MDIELQSNGHATLTESDLHAWYNESTLVDYGAIVLCLSGRATVDINFRQWQLSADAVITFFCNDMVMLTDVSDDFRVEILRYDTAMLREASLQLEQTVYSSLRSDRCRSDSPVVAEIIRSMFNLLEIYFRQEACQCLDRLVLLQLKAFFIGFYDYLQRTPSNSPEATGSTRINDLFNHFMESLEAHYREQHDVSFYADLLCISSKYLNNIVQMKTNHSTKTIIDHYLIMQLKLTLRTNRISVKQISWDYHFNDLSFFCRYFKKHTGLSPQQYRDLSFESKKSQG